jgi:hypothetical protein
VFVASRAAPACQRGMKVDWSSRGAIDLRYQCTPRMAFATRAEYLSDRGGLFSGITQVLKENTCTFDYKLTEGAPLVTVRCEQVSSRYIAVKRCGPAFAGIRASGRTSFRRDYGKGLRPAVSADSKLHGITDLQCKATMRATRWGTSTLAAEQRYYVKDYPCDSHPFAPE